VVEKKPHHFDAGVRATGIRIGSTGAAAGPCMRCAVDDPILPSNGIELLREFGAGTPAVAELVDSPAAQRACTRRRLTASNGVEAVPWGEVGWAVIWPSLSAKPDYIVAVVAVMGTTISPYLFFWQAEQEVEDEKERPGAHALTHAPWQARAEFSRIRIDTYLGMAISNVIAPRQ
jgi:hypothetical protein